MNIIKLNNYIPRNPSTYDISYSDIDGEKSQVEDGTTFIERVRSNIPTIKVGWVNLTQEEVERITSEVSSANIQVEYYYGEVKSAIMNAKDRSLKLKCVDTQEKSYWDLSFTLEG